jgi:hypothetical protein
MPEPIDLLPAAPPPKKASPMDWMEIQVWMQVLLSKRKNSPETETEDY